MVLLYFVTVHSVLSNVAKIHSRLPAAMEFWLVCLGILAYSCQNTSRDSDVWTVIIFLMFYQEALLHLWTPHLFFFLPNDNLKHNEFSPPITRTLRKFNRIFAIRFRHVAHFSTIYSENNLIVNSRYKFFLFAFLFCAKFPWHRTLIPDKINTT